MIKIISILGTIFPKIKNVREKNKAVDTLISKRGETSEAEVIMAYSYKILSLLFKVYIVYLVIFDNAKIMDVLKILLTSKIM